MWSDKKRYVVSDKAWCDMWRNVMWCVIICNVMWCDVVWCDVFCGVMWYVVWYVTQCDVIIVTFDVICDVALYVMWCDTVYDVMYLTQWDAICNTTKTYLDLHVCSRAQSSPSGMALPKGTNNICCWFYYHRRGQCETLCIRVKLLQLNWVLHTFEALYMISCRYALHETRNYRLRVYFFCCKIESNVVCKRTVVSMSSAVNPNATSISWL